MSYVAETLEIFNGQLSLDDIYNHTYKELDLLRKHRLVIRDAKKNALSLPGLTQ